MFNIGEVLMPSFRNPIFSTQLSTVSCNIFPTFSCLLINPSITGKILNVLSSISNQSAYPTHKLLQLPFKLALNTNTLLNILRPKFTRPTKQRAKLRPKQTYQRNIKIIHHRSRNRFNLWLTRFSHWLLRLLLPFLILRLRLFKL